MLAKVKKPMADKKKVMRKVKLSEAQKKVVDEGFVPLPKELVERLYGSLGFELEQPHGEDRVKWVNVETGEEYRDASWLGVKNKARVYVHEHKEERHKVPHTPHATWHEINDMLVAIKDYGEEKEKKKETMLDAVKELKSE